MASSFFKECRLGPVYRKLSFLRSLCCISYFLKTVVHTARIIHIHTKKLRIIPPYWKMKSLLNLLSGSLATLILNGSARPLSFRFSWLPFRRFWKDTAWVNLWLNRSDWSIKPKSSFSATVSIVVCEFWLAYFGYK